MRGNHASSSGALWSRQCACNVPIPTCDGCRISVTYFSCASLVGALCALRPLRFKTCLASAPVLKGQGSKCCSCYVSLVRLGSQEWAPANSRHSFDADCVQFFRFNWCWLMPWALVWPHVACNFCRFMVATCCNCFAFTPSPGAKRRARLPPLIPHL